MRAIRDTMVLAPPLVITEEEVEAAAQAAPSSASI
jgi:adenosylmethionine-8-amino-7-oxononanoate aminotransferase